MPRGLWTTVALAVILAGLGAYIYVDWNKPADTGPKQEKVFPTLQASRINELTVKSQSGDVTTLRKDNGWKIVKPMEIKASQPDAEGIPNTLALIEMTRVIEEKAADLKPYGLDPPNVEIDYKLDDGKTGSLKIGQKTATGNGIYATRNEDRKVFLLQAFQESTFNRTTFDLRDKTLVSIDRDKLDGIEVSGGRKALQFTKDGAEWKLTKPIMDRADSIAMDGLLGRIDTIQMKSVTKEAAQPADLKMYGLDKPQVSLTLNAGSARATVDIGGKADDSSVYARDPAKPLVATIDKAVLDELTKGADEYRRKDLFDFRPFNATHVEFIRMGQTVTFDRAKADKDGPDKWKRSSPNPADLDVVKVENLLAAFANMRVDSFPDSKTKTGLDAPSLTVDAKYEDGKKEERLSFAQIGNDVYVSRPGATGAGKIDTDKYTAALKQLDELSK